MGVPGWGVPGRRSGAVAVRGAGGWDLAVRVSILERKAARSTAAVKQLRRLSTVI